MNYTNQETLPKYNVSYYYYCYSKYAIKYNWSQIYCVHNAMKKTSHVAEMTT